VKIAIVAPPSAILASIVVVKLQMMRSAIIAHRPLLILKKPDLGVKICRYIPIGT
jgi:hypothetical protein